MAERNQTLGTAYPQDRILVVPQNESSGTKTALAVGLCAIGGVLIWRAIKDANDHQTNVDPNYGEAGWQGHDYGGGELDAEVANAQYAIVGQFYNCVTGLGLLLVSACNTDSTAFNAMTTFWVVTSDPNLYLFYDELGRWWKTSRTRVSEASPIHVSEATGEEKDAILSSLADGNVAGVFDALVPCADWSVSYGIENGYSQGENIGVHHVLFPEPRNAGLNATPLTDQGISSFPAWRMRSATITLTPIMIARKNGIGYKRTHVKVNVDIPGLVRYTYMMPGKKANYFEQHLRNISLDLAWSLGAQGMLNDYATTDFIYTNQRGSKANAFRKAVQYWGGICGLFGRGTVSIQALSTGVSGLRNSAVAWTQQWLNGLVDVTDLGALFQSLLISPKAVALIETMPNIEQFQQFAYCWLANVDGSQPRLVAHLPVNTQPFTFLTTDQILVNGDSELVELG